MTEHSQPLELQEALSRLTASIAPVRNSETIAVSESLGRVLARRVEAPVSLPPFPASAMDGYAVRRSDWDNGVLSYAVIDESRAGHPATQGIGPTQAVRIFTGAVVPRGADLVLLQERANRTNDRVDFEPHAPAESYVRPVGHDIERGTPIAQAGELISGFTIGALAAAGVVEVDVLANPIVGVFSSGDELVDGGAALAPGQIYDSNRITVINLLADAPCQVVDLGCLPDDPTEVANRLDAAARNCDCLITSGGVSVGDADFITSTINRLGELDFWRLNLKPGKPLAFGRIGSCYIFGLPGNPVSTIVTLLLLAKPAIAHLAGAVIRTPLRLSATLTSTAPHTPGRTEFQRGILEHHAETLTVTPTGDQSSNRLSTFRGANCLIEIPGRDGDLPSGSTVTVLPLAGLLASAF